MTHTVHRISLYFTVRAHQVCRIEFCAKQRVFLSGPTDTIYVSYKVVRKPALTSRKKKIIIIKKLPGTAIKWHSLIFSKVRLVVLVLKIFFSSYPTDETNDYKYQPSRSAYFAFRSQPSDSTIRGGSILCY